MDKAQADLTTGCVLVLLSRTTFEGAMAADGWLFAAKFFVAAAFSVGAAGYFLSAARTWLRRIR